MRNDPWCARLRPEVTLAMPHGHTSNGSDEAPLPAAPIIDAIRQPLLLLDGELCVTAANRAFCLTFGLRRHDILGRPIRALGDGQWDVPELRARLETILPQHSAMDMVRGRDATDGAMITSFGKYDLARFKVWTDQAEGAHSERELQDLLRTRPDSPALTLAPIGSQHWPCRLPPEGRGIGTVFGSPGHAGSGSMAWRGPISVRPCCRPRWHSAPGAPVL